MEIKNPRVMYAGCGHFEEDLGVLMMVENTAVYKTTDGGATWKKYERSQKLTWQDQDLYYKVIQILFI